MHRSRPEGYNRDLSLKLFERPKVDSTSTKAHEASESPQKASPTMFSLEQAKYMSKTRVFDFALQSVRNGESKVDNKIIFNTASTAINPVSFLQPQLNLTKTRWKSTSNNKFLPKLISKACDSSRNIIRNRPNLHNSTLIDKTQNDTYRVSVERHEDKGDSSPKPNKDGTSIGEDDTYRSFLIEEPRKEEDLRKLVSKLKAQNSTMRWRISRLEKENHDLKEIVQNYKTAQNKGNNNNISFESPPPVEKSKFFEAPEESALSNSPSPRLRNRSPTVKAEKPVDAGLNYRLNNIFRTFSKFKSLYYTLDSAVTEACKIFDCRYARIFLTNEPIKRVYEAGSEKNKIDKIMIGDLRAELIQRNDDNILDYEIPTFGDNINDLKKPFSIDTKGLSYPIFSINESQEFLGAIQIVGPMTTTKHDRTPRKKGWNPKDELLLETFAKILSVIIDSHHRDWILKEVERKVTVYNDSMSHMITTRTHQDLLELIKARLGEHFGFEHIGILFYESKENLLFTFDIQRKQDGRYYNSEPIRFSSRAGISGCCVNQNIEMMSLNEPRTNKFFQPEIDNVAGAPAVRNVLLALLKDKNGHKVGVLQLVNKIDYQDIDAKDELMVRALQRLLGSLIAHIADVNAAVALSFALKKNVKNIEDTFAL